MLENILDISTFSISRYYSMYKFIFNVLFIYINIISQEVYSKSYKYQILSIYLLQGIISCIHKFGAKLIIDHNY